MKNYLKINISYFIIGLIWTVIINYFISQDEIKNNTPTNSEKQSIQVEVWEIRKSIEVVWDAELVDEQSLTFNKVGTVTEVYFTEGDEVKKWETIARLDDSDAYRNIEEAKISLTNAKISFSDLYEPVDESKTKQANNSIFNAQTNYDTAVKELENLKITQENTIVKLENNIENQTIELELSKQANDNSLTSKESSKNTTVQNIEDWFKDYLLSIEDIIEESDIILWVTSDRKDQNDDYDSFLWAKNTAVKNESKVYLSQALDLHDSLKVNIDNYNNSWDKDELITLLQENLTLFKTLYNTTDTLYKAIDNSITSIWSLTESDINSMKQTISQARSSTLSKIDNINSEINTLTSLTDTELESSNYTLSINKMTVDLENTIKELETTKTKYEIEYNSKVSDIESKKESLEIAKISLIELNEWPTSSNISKANNSITQAELKLESAYEDLDDYILTAPFDWVIRKIDYRPGDNLKDDNNKYVYIENPNLLEVNVMLDQIDIVQVEKWNSALVTFDAYANQSVKAKISNIDTTPVKVSGVVSYQVTLILDDPDFSETVLSGMTADVEIINELKEDILLLQTSAITNEWDSKYVNLSVNWNVVKTVVETWLSSDWKTEIISGLKKWDTVTVGTFKIAWAEKEEEEKSTLFSTPSAWWGGPSRWWR